MLGQIAIALFDGIESGFGTEGGEPWCPDMGGNEKGVGMGVADNVQQVTRIEFQWRASVGFEFAVFSQCAVEFAGTHLVGNVDAVVDLSCPIVLAIDCGYLDLQDEAGWLPAGWRQVCLLLELSLESEETGLGGASDVSEFHGAIPDG